MSDQEVLASLFDSDFYLRSNPDVAQAKTEPLVHYLTHGWKECRDPYDGFSTEWYLDNHPELLETNVPPLLHFQNEGRAAGALPKPLTDDFPQISAKDEEIVAQNFDVNFYLSSYGSSLNSREAPLVHYLKTGWKEGYDPSAQFSTNWYLEQNADVANSDLIPFVHWVLHGRAEGRAGHNAPPKIEIDENNVDWAVFDPDDLHAIQSSFDTNWYLEHYPEVADAKASPPLHYLLLGWLKGYNPNAEFSTNFYIESNPDIRKARINPFVHFCRHGQNEGRAGISYIDHRKRSFEPLVSVVIPNYNHARFLRQRIESVALQTYKNIELIILDDCSTDESRQVIKDITDELGLDAQFVFNEKNSGNVFRQWRKGFELASGDLVWVCESDDFCEPDFLEHIVPTFADESVNAAFGRIQFADDKGDFMPGMDAYRENAEAGTWSGTVTRPAREWFCNALGVNNVMSNVSGCVFRRMTLPDKIWKEASTFKICGDWFLYLHLANAGQIAFAEKSVAYFRQHGSNTSASNFNRLYYYKENARILAELVRHWGIPLKTRERFVGQVRTQFEHLNMKAEHDDFDEIFETQKLMSAVRSVNHIQLHFLGFHTGGGELFPINLANALVDAGVFVSMLAIDLSEINPDMRQRLDSRVAVYTGENLRAGSRKAFFETAGVSLVNSHMASCDVQLWSADTSDIEVPYTVTLHGSYVGLEDAPADVVDWILQNVTSWIYTAERNKEFFVGRDIDVDSFKKLPNAMPQDHRPAEFTREDLGIAKGDVVFTLVARGVKRKGWRAVIGAYERLSKSKFKKKIHLLLVGEGDSVDEMRKVAQEMETVHFLGYQSEINGILRISDCLLLPSRFEGESFPLCLIQAFQEGVPSIATDIGEINAMMTDKSGKAGIVLENLRNSSDFFDALAEAMKKMCSPTARKKFKAVAMQRQKAFSMKNLTKSYLDSYQKTIADFHKRD